MRFLGLFSGSMNGVDAFDMRLLDLGSYADVGECLRMRMVSRDLRFIWGQKYTLKRELSSSRFASIPLDNMGALEGGFN